LKRLCESIRRHTPLVGQDGCSLGWAVSQYGKTGEELRQYGDSPWR
jgi:hypothetical protein